MTRPTRRRSARDVERTRPDPPAVVPRAGVADVLRLQRAAGNQAVAAALVGRPSVGDRAPTPMLARNPSGAAPVKDRTRIDDLAKEKVSPVERTRRYAQIAGTDSVDMDSSIVHVSPFYKDGVNLDALKQARTVYATAGFIDAANRFSGGAPPETAKGVAIVVNSNSERFEDEDYMVAAIRHEMVHARLMRLTLKHLAAWKQAPRGLSFPQYVDKSVAGTDGALIKDRFFGGHMDETVAYAEGFLSAFFYAPVAQPGTADHAWIAHLKDFTKEFEKARANSGPPPKSRTGISEQNLAIRDSANAVITETEKLVKQYCDAGGDARRTNLAAWMQHFYKRAGMHDAALKMIYKVASNGKTMPEPKP